MAVMKAKNITSHTPLSPPVLSGGQKHQPQLPWICVRSGETLVLSGAGQCLERGLL